MVFCNDNTKKNGKKAKEGHNPYFNRWFSAISKNNYIEYHDEIVTILILIDGFLQFKQAVLSDNKTDLSQSLF